MSDIREEDLLLGEDIDDQALYGADEDELLLTDEELEKDVTNEEKQQIKAEAEQWVREQMQEQYKRPKRNTDINEKLATQNNIKSEPLATTEVSSTANSVQTAALMTTFPQGDDVSTSEAAPQQIRKEEIITNETRKASQALDSNIVQNSNRTNAEDTISSSSRDIDGDHISLISCSTSENVTDSSILPSSQESLTGGSVGGVSRDFADPRDDCDDEREERTNIKTTNEREVESASSSDQSPDVHHRYNQNKRLPGDGPHSLIRPHRYSTRPPYPLRPMMNRGVYPPMSHGHFPLQHPVSNAPSHNMYAPPTTQQHTHGGLPPSPTNPMNSVSSAQEMMPRMPLRHPYPGFRPGAPMPVMGGGSFRHPMHGNIYGPQDYNGSGGSHVPPPYGQNFLPHPPGVRGIFRPEMAPRMPPPPGIRIQRAPLPQHNLPSAGSGFPSVPTVAIRPQIPTQQSTQPSLPSVATSTSNVSNLPQAPTSVSTTAVTNSSVRPSKVLINPNFKGGVEAATSKFIQETQYMAAIGGAPRSDDELLRQQEEFINKNRQHIEKRRNERAISPTPARRTSRSRSRSRTPRSRSRERSYTPPSKRNVAAGGSERHFERERDRDRERERERDRERERERERGGGSGTTRAGSRERDRERERERDRERDRDRGAQAYGNRSGGNRFRRGNSRDRGGAGDYESRTGNGGGLSNYSKRRRSISPSANRGSSAMTGGRRGRSSDRDRNEEDDETRAYRLQIEKQKELREKIMRDKEMKRRRAAEEKQHEEKRSAPQPSNNNNGQSSSQANKTNNASSNASYDELQKFKPIIVTQPKIISLKKRQQPSESNNERQRQRSSSPQGAPPPRKQLPTAKILPEAKRTLTEHITSSMGSGGTSSGGGGHSSNTAIIKPVQKSREMSSHHRHTPPLLSGMMPTSLPSKHTRRLSTPSDDEVQLDYDEDELMLDEEDRLLATPTPSPSHRKTAISRTPSPEPPLIQSSRHKSQKVNTTSSGMTFSSSNRRVVLKQNHDRGSGSETTSGRNRRGNSRQRDTGNSSSGGGNSSSRKGIFDRLDVRNSGGNNSSSGAGSDTKRKAHRIVLKHD